ncbi:hypothetical protein RvY_16642-1 [Ramazzottius varieornatus]|uniref:Methyltransferase domain-containing protein n=1 Tax=Ramazzottius varieornatus TaxID=947166 RepID=A0A1D1W0E3_RAMVA|nr:hypothetical protein RvY_16642-1 [Ramazzottius varieornatus]
MGVMLEDVGKFDGEFLDAVKQSPKNPLKILDLCVAYGFTTKELLKTGADVTADDLSEEHLKHLWETVSEEERTRLQLLPGNAVELEFPAKSVDGIMACRWFNFLTGDKVRKVLEKSYNWLVPSGTLCVTAESIHSACFVNAYAKYVRAKESSAEDE